MSKKYQVCKIAFNLGYAYSVNFGNPHPERDERLSQMIDRYPEYEKNLIAAWHDGYVKGETDILLGS